MASLPTAYLNALEERLLSSQLISDLSRRRAYATDASFYQLTPALVLKLDDLSEVQDVLALSFLHNVPVTFRAAGTSLSGQAITDSVLIMLSPQWRGHTILDEGRQIILQPGVVGADANKYLAPYGRKIGPDPASINSCKIGGIAANNASGMCCGVANNTFYTVAAMTIVLADGTVLKTDDPQSVAAFKISHVDLCENLSALARDVQGNSELSALIAHKYRLKNTTGYAINALTDFTDPIDILMHLMVGSEGTLGFIADITYNTVVEHPHKATALYLFATPAIACDLSAALNAAPVDAAELLDQRALNSVKGKPGLPDSFCDRDIGCTAVLIETAGCSATSLQRQITELEALVATFGPVEAIPFTTDAILASQLWAIRKATFPAVGAVRETGTTVIIEDVSFPNESLAAGLEGLHRLFDKYQYDEAIIFGHALAGNLHFVFTQAFDTDEQIARYDNFMQDVAQLVAVDFGGSLKAEHGTGRNMAPFVELEWGEQAYQVMQQVKRIMDPTYVLNPGVIINDDDTVHIKNLKALPAANEIVDKCIECGFCEVVCPSKDLTFTPRQRIHIWRRIQQLKNQSYLIDAERQELGQLEHDFDYFGIDSCAATGLCAERCPVGINTGDLVRALRAEKMGKFGKTIASFSADHFAGVTKAVKTTLGTASRISRILGPAKTDKTGALLRKASGNTLPLWFAQYPDAAHPLPVSATNSRQQVIYFPSCATRNMGAAPTATEQRSVHEAVTAVLHKAGYDVLLPDDIEGLCCGMPFHSKGLPEIASNKGDELLQRLRHYSQHGEIPIIFDTSPCKLRLQELGHELPIFETTEFVAEHVLDKLTITPQSEPVALHVTCSSQKMGIAGALRKVANACAKQVVEPEGIHCCGFAGDKGMTLPELNASALADLRKQVNGICSSGYSNSRTCEIGLSQHAGIDYQNLMFLLDDVSRG
jgi:D-lactate dehydrogenase